MTRNGRSPKWCAILSSSRVSAGIACLRYRMALLALAVVGVMLVRRPRSNNKRQWRRGEISRTKWRCRNVGVHVGRAQKRYRIGFLEMRVCAASRNFWRVGKQSLLCRQYRAASIVSGLSARGSAAAIGARLKAAAGPPSLACGIGAISKKKVRTRKPVHYWRGANNGGGQ